MKDHFKVSQRTIERWIKQLKNENKIEFKGAPKTGGYYKINEESGS
jgi:ATP-dependent DNA helicase RecG